MEVIKKTIICLLCAILLLGSAPEYKVNAGPIPISSQKDKMTGWQTINGKRYYYNKKGIRVTGLKKIGGYQYYFSKKGVMQTGLRTIGKKKYYFDKNIGYMMTTAIYKEYLIAYNGVCHKIPDKKTGNKTEDAQRVAKLIAKCIQKGGRDIDRVRQAAFYVSVFCSKCKYTMSGPNYSEAYGVFIAKEYSCAGATRALGMVLDNLGYRWTHANRNQYTHQWCRLKMDGRTGYADGQIGAAGYGKHPVEKQ